RRLCTLSGERGLCIRQRLLRFRHFSLGLFRLLPLLRRALLRVGCLLILLLGVALRLLCVALLPIWRTRRTSKHEGGHGKQNPSHELLRLLELQAMVCTTGRFRSKQALGSIHLCPHSLFAAPIFRTQIRSCAGGSRL